MDFNPGEDSGSDFFLSETLAAPSNDGDSPDGNAVVVTNMHPHSGSSDSMLLIGGESSNQIEDNLFIGGVSSNQNEDSMLIVGESSGLDIETNVVSFCAVLY